MIQMSPASILYRTPYWSQVALLRDVIVEFPAIEISTVDGFQGCEKEMIIISFVRSNSKQTVGFLDDARRINVSITRAKKCCLVIGDISTLNSNPDLAHFVDYCRRHQVIYNADQWTSRSEA